MSDAAKSFMAGYRREPTMGAQLEVALAQAMRAHPTQRLGQIIVNYCVPFGAELADLFNLRDEELLAGLRRAAERGQL